MASINHTTTHINTINPPTKDIVRDTLQLVVYILWALLAILTPIYLISIYGDFITGRSKLELRQVLLRMLEAPPGPARDKVILDSCVEIHDWFYPHLKTDATCKMIQEMVARVPGAERHWERKHPGLTRYLWVGSLHGGLSVRWDLERDAERHKRNDELGRDEKSPSLFFFAEKPGNISDDFCSKTRLRNTLRR